MDDHLVTFGSDDNDDFEKVCRPIWADDQPPVGILAHIIDNQRVLDGMNDVVVIDTVTPSRRVDLHTPILYYKSR